MSQFSEAVIMRSIISNHIISEKPDYIKIQSEIKKELNIHIPIKSLEHIVTFYRLIYKLEKTISK